MLHLKLCARHGGCLLQVSCSNHAGFLNRVGVPLMGETVLRCSQVDAAHSEFPRTAANFKEPSDNRKQESKQKESPQRQSHSSHGFKTSSARFGSGGGIRKNKVKSHLYASIYPWTTKNELVDTLMDSQIFDNDDLLVLNKPYGVAQVNTGSRRTYGVAPPPFTLKDVLPILRELVCAPDLAISIAPEKWQSGVLVLTKKKKSRDRIEYNKRVAPSKQVCVRQFWAITRNRTYPSERHYRMAALRGETIPSGPKVAVLEFTPSLNRVRQQLVDRFYATHSTLAESETTKAALMQVGVTRTMHNSVRVWLTHHLAPPLGDHLFAGRVAYLLNTPVPVPHSRASTQPPYAFELLKSLELTHSIQDLMPLMLHLRTVTLPLYYTGSTVKNKALDLGCFKQYSKNTPQDSGTEENRVQFDAEAPAMHDVDGSLNSSSKDGKKFESVDVDGVDEKQLHNNLTQAIDKTAVINDFSPRLIFTAPVPEHFSWTMEKLGIKIPSV